MIIVHEGLPRSGKSYEAIVRRVLPALQAGRAVYTNIEGIDFVRFSEALSLPEDEVRALLHVLDGESLLKLPSLGLKNCLLVLDEVQNTWGVRARLGADMTKFVAEHGHHGIDVILMTQDLKDIHVIWRRRVEIRQITLKLTGVGRPNHYSVTTYRGKGSELYEKVGTSIVRYDPKYFGLYKSYSDSDVSTDVLADTRASVFGTATFRYIIPGVLLAGAVGIWNLWGFFTPEDAPKPAPSGPSAPPAPAVPAAPAVLHAAPVLTSPVGPSAPRPVDRIAAEIDARRKPVADLFGSLDGEYRIRLAGLVRAPGKPDAGVIEWRTDGGSIRHRFDLQQLRDLGAVLVVHDSHVVVQYGDARYLATMWPLEDPLGKVSQPQLRSVGEASVGPSRPSAAPPAAPRGPAGTRASSGANDASVIAWMRSQ